MKKQITFLIGLVAIFIFLNIAQAQYPEAPSPQPILNFFFRVYNNDTVELIKLELATGYPFSSEIGNYKVKIISADGRTINESKVDVLFLYNKVKKDGVVVNASIREFVDVYLSLPYYSEASKIELYHFNKLIYQKEVPKELLFDTCGNGFCDLEENAENCPRDCLVEVTTTTLKTTTTTIKIQRKESKYPLFLIITIFVLFILVVSFILIYKKIKSR